jgi:hypothetical protein
MQERIARVLAKFARKKEMSAAALTSLTRSALGALVEYEERRSGSRMIAYGIVAKKIGVSSSWIRAFLGRSEGVKEPRITLFQNIRASYENLCRRVEQENREDEHRLRLIKGEIDAVTEGFGTQSLRESEAVEGPFVGVDP